MPSPHRRPKPARPGIDLTPEEELAARITDPNAFAELDAAQNPLHALALRSMARAIESNNPERALRMVGSAQSFRRSRP